MTWTQKLEDKLRRTDYAGQLGFDGSEIRRYRLRAPRTSLVAELAEDDVIDEASGTAMENVLPFDE